MLPCAEMHRCVLMEGVKMTLQEGRLYGNLTIRACDDLACSEKLDPKNRSPIVRFSITSNKRDVVLPMQ